MSLLLLLLALGVNGSITSYLIGYDETCTYTRQDVVNCFQEYVDTNHDGVISVEELDAAQVKYVSWALRLVKYVAGWAVDTRTSTILRDCDFNHDGKFTPDDFLKSQKTCVPTQMGLCMIKMVCDKGAEKAKQDASPKKSWWIW